jgi:hypothetical protein
MEGLARRVRELLSTQGFEKQDVIQFATLLLDNVVDEVKEHHHQTAQPR